MTMANSNSNRTAKLSAKRNSHFAFGFDSDVQRSRWISASKSKGKSKKSTNRGRKGTSTLPFNDSDGDSDARESTLIKRMTARSMNKIPAKVQRLLAGATDTHDTWKRVHQLVTTRDVLTDLTFSEKDLVWSCREQLCKMHGALYIFLRSVDWRDWEQRNEAYDFLERWTPSPYMEDALELLGFELMDTRVREYAVMMVAAMHDSELHRYLLQLVQCLKFELHHNNSLIRLLMRRALMNVEQIGHHFYWHLRSEYWNLKHSERFGLYMEEFLSCLIDARSYVVQHNILRHLSIINDRLRVAKKFERTSDNKKYSKDELNGLLRQSLTALNENIFSDVPTSFVLPINPRWRLTKINVESCRIMSSAQMPLWLEFCNSDEHAIGSNKVLFKTGDDLRQDILTLQVLKCMDKVWLDRGLDLRLMPYSVVATDNGIGMVEIVQAASTTTWIHTHYGGGAQKGARDPSTHWLYLQEHNRRAANFEHARDIYSRSCAGYCIASYVLGLGDRHPSNIMVRQKGELFHIDFSHFLGNFKSQAIIGDYVKWQRETAPFVFIPGNKYVVDDGGKDKANYNRFLQYCCNAYLALRQRQRLFISLFVLMIPSQMPELIEKQHIEYMRDALHLTDIKNEDVYNHITSVVKQCLNDKRRIMDNLLHAVKHQ